MFLKYLCEFLGTMMLILLGDGVVANVTLNKSGMKGAGSIQITIAWGLAVMVPAFIFGEASGASFNPALTIALAVGGMFDWALVPGYVIAQILGGVVGTFRLTGQFFMVTVFGVGEVALSIPFGDQHDGQFEFCVKKVGKVTSALAKLGVGDVIGLRGPYGKGFPYRSFAGRDVLVVGSGVGLAPVRTIIVRLLQERERYGRIAIIASATRYEGLVYKQDLKDWSKIPGVTVQYALAKPTDAVQAHVGYINDLLPELPIRL